MELHPKSYKLLYPAAKRAQEGVEALGVQIGLKQITLEVITGAIDKLAGNAAEPGNHGSEAAFDLAAEQERAKRLAFRDLLKEGCTLMADTVDVLKRKLGRTFSADWRPLGFSVSLTLPRNPISVLSKMANYLSTHPELAVTAGNITAEHIRDLLGRIHARAGDLANAENLAKAAMQLRDTDRYSLYKILLNLKSELKMLLADDDPRFYAFGFDRPIDGRIPTPVKDLTATAGLPGKLMLSWTASSRAKQYRVTYHPVDQPDAVVALDLTPGTEMLLEGLASGAKLALNVSAFNKAGETLPATVEAVVP